MPGDLTGQRLLENWTKAGVWADRITLCHAVATRFPELDVLLDAGRDDWFQARFGNDPDYVVKQVASFSGWESLTLWHVRRVLPGVAPC